MNNDLTEFFTSLFMEVLNDPILLWFSVAILSFAAFAFVKTSWEFFSLSGRLQKLKSGLESQLGAEALGEEHFEKQDISELTEANGALIREFRKAGFDSAGALILRHLIFYRNNGGPTMECEILESCLSPNGLERRHIPKSTSGRSTILTSLGVLGTFVGLVYGVSAASEGLASPDISIARASLSTLLSGAELAFLTSILGLALSTVHTMWLTFCRQRLSIIATNLFDYLSMALGARSSGTRLAICMNSVSLELNEQNAMVSEMLDGISQTNERLNSIQDLQKSTEQSLSRLASIAEAFSKLDKGRLTSADFGEGTNADIKAIHKNVDEMSSFVRDLRQENYIENITRFVHRTVAKNNTEAQ